MIEIKARVPEPKSTVEPPQVWVRFDGDATGFSAAVQRIRHEIDPEVAVDWGPIVGQVRAHYVDRENDCEVTLLGPTLTDEPYARPPAAQALAQAAQATP